MCIAHTSTYFLITKHILDRNMSDAKSDEPLHLMDTLRRQIQTVQTHSAIHYFAAKTNKKWNVRNQNLLLIKCVTLLQILYFKT